MKKLIAKIEIQNFNIAQTPIVNSKTKKPCTVVEIATTHKEGAKFYRLNCWGATAKEALTLTKGSRIKLKNVSLYEETYKGRSKGVIHINSSSEINISFIRRRKAIL